MGIISGQINGIFSICLQLGPDFTRTVTCTLVLNVFLTIVSTLADKFCQYNTNHGYIFLQENLLNLKAKPVFFPEEILFLRFTAGGFVRIYTHDRNVYMEKN